MKKILEGLKILLVEEEALIAMDIEHLCYELGAATVMTISAASKLSPEALDTAEAQSQISEANAAILDTKVGDGSTTELARHLKRRGIPFVFATGYTRGEAFFAEFPDIPVVAKPYSGDELMGAILAAIEQTKLTPLPVNSSLET